MNWTNVAISWTHWGPSLYVSRFFGQHLLWKISAFVRLHWRRVWQFPDSPAELLGRFVFSHSKRSVRSTQPGCRWQLPSCRGCLTNWPRWWFSQKLEQLPQIIHMFNRIFHLKPSSWIQLLGHPHCWIIWFQALWAVWSSGAPGRASEPHLAEIGAMTWWVPIFFGASKMEKLPASGQASIPKPLTLAQRFWWTGKIKGQWV